MKVAIIGARRTRNGIGEYIAKYFDKNGAKVVAVLGTTQKTAEESSRNLRKYGIEPVPYADFDRMVKQEHPDAVVIASPSATHYEYLVKCIEAGVDIFCEKPFFWDQKGNITERIEDIFTKARRQKLTVAMNSQLPFTIPYYEKICGRIREPAEFLINMSPPVEGKEMIPESVPHVLSILYFSRGEGDIRNLVFESVKRDSLALKFNYTSGTTDCAVLINLTTEKSPPRDLSFGFNGKTVTRTIGLPASPAGGKNYEIYFNYEGKKVKVRDPLESSVKDFLKACQKKTEPVIGEPHIRNNMSLLERIYRGYQEKS